MANHNLNLRLISCELNNSSRIRMEWNGIRYILSILLTKPDKHFATILLQKQTTSKLGNIQLLK